MKTLILILFFLAAALTGCSTTGTVTAGKPCQIFGIKSKSKTTVGTQSYEKHQRQRAIANARRASRL